MLNGFYFTLLYSRSVCLKMLAKAIIFLQLLLFTFAAKYELPPEWHAWKDVHSVSYESEHEELRKHVVWRSNQKYIEEHNKYQDVFGYSLEMNKYGDMVRNNIY